MFTALLAKRRVASSSSRAASCARRSRKMERGTMGSGGGASYAAAYLSAQSAWVAATSHLCTAGLKASPAAKGRPVLRSLAHLWS